MSATDRIKALREQYAQLPRVHFRATTDTKVADIAKGITIDGAEAKKGSFEFWADNGKYRANYAFDNHFGEPRTDWNIAYDGTRYQQLDNTVLRLIYKKTDDNRHPASPPNPLLLPLRFIIPKTEPKSVPQLMISDISRDEWWTQAMTDICVIAEPDGQHGLVVSIHGNINDPSQQIRVEFCSDAEKQHLPKIIVLPVKGKGLDTIIEIERYQQVDGPTGAQWWPAITTVKIMQGDKCLCVQRSVFEAFDFALEMPADIFTIDHSKADIIWDDDVQVFVKTLGGFRLPSNIDNGTAGNVSTSMQPMQDSASSAHGSGSTNPSVNRITDQQARQNPYTHALPRYTMRIIVGVSILFLGIGLLVLRHWGRKDQGIPRENGQDTTRR